MRLLLDEHFSPAIAVQLRERGHDVIGVAETPELAGLPDAVLLDPATRAARVLVTENVRDFAVLLRTAPHRGVVFTSHARFPRNAESVGSLVLALDRFLHELHDEPPGFVHWLERT